MQRCKMKHVLIIEDEIPAADKLARFIHQYDAGLEIHGPLSSVTSAVKWLSNPQNNYDLIFMDIHLADGPCFEIFKQIAITQPIIFTTAYNEYALQAFQHNSIAYLLKPLSYSQFVEGMNQFSNMKHVFHKEAPQQNKLLSLLSNLQQSYKSRFMVKSGERIKSIEIEGITCFYAEGRTVFLLTTTKRKYIVDYTLAELERLINPKLFFRVNRTYFVHIKAIQEVILHSNSRLKLILHGYKDLEIIVSREKVSAFKSWFDGMWLK